MPSTPSGRGSKPIALRPSGRSKLNRFHDTPPRVMSQRAAEARTIAVNRLESTERGRARREDRELRVARARGADRARHQRPHERLADRRGRRHGRGRRGHRRRRDPGVLGVDDLRQQLGRVLAAEPETQLVRALRGVRGEVRLRPRRSPESRLQRSDPHDRVLVARLRGEDLRRERVPAAVVRRIAGGLGHREAGRGGVAGRAQDADRARVGPGGVRGNGEQERHGEDEEREQASDPEHRGEDRSRVRGAAVLDVRLGRRPKTPSR